MYVRRLLGLNILAGSRCMCMRVDNVNIYNVNVADHAYEPWRPYTTKYNDYLNL